ncbi:MAG: hypothetical protein RLZZ628_3726 [Bacteroidota bacterium]|jgi:hypothetical protein
MSLVTTQYVLQAPIDTVRSFVDAQATKFVVIEIAPKYKQMKQLISILHALVMEMKTDILQFTPEAAQKSLDLIQPALKSIPLLDRAMQQFVPIHPQEKEVIEKLRNLWVTWLSLIMDLEMVAQVQVDENAPEYQTFLANIMAEAIQTPQNQRTIGRKQLFALLD